MQPTVITGLTDSAECMQEEIFGKLDAFSIRYLYLKDHRCFLIVHEFIADVMSMCE